MLNNVLALKKRFSRFGFFGPPGTYGAYLAIALYPTWFLSIGLKTNSRYLFGEFESDTSGALWYAQVLKNMRFPWSQNLTTNFPDGEPFWYLLKFTQMFQWLFLWFATRFVDPVVAVNTLLWVGWVSTGVSVYVLSKRFGFPSFLAMCAAISVESMPWFREKITSHTSYLFLSIPLISLILLDEYLKHNRQRNFWILGSFVLFSALFDMYLFYMTLILIVSYLLCLKIRILRLWLAESKKRIVFILLGVSLLYLLVFRFLLNAVNSVKGIRKISVPERSFIDLLSGSWQDYLFPDRYHWVFPFDWHEGRSDRWGGIMVDLPIGIAQDIPNYMGIVVAVFCLLAFVKPIRNRLSHPIRVLSIVTICLFSLSIKTISFASYETPVPSAVFKYVLPGLRVFSRFAMLAEVLAIVVAFACVQACTTFFPKRVFKRVFICLVFALVLLDFHPTNQRELFDEFKSVQDFNDLINQNPEAGVLVIGDIPEGTISAPLMNSMTNGDWKYEIASQYQIGWKELAAYLGERNISFVVTEEPTSVPISLLDSEVQWKLDFNNPYFKKLRSEDVEYTAPDGTFLRKKITLFKVVPPVGFSSCADCIPLETRIDFGFVEKADSVGSTNWVQVRRLDLILSTPISKSQRIGVEIELESPFGGFALPRSVTIRSAEKLLPFEVLPGGSKIRLEVENGSTISITTKEDCVIPSLLEEGNPDNRCLLYGIKSIKGFNSSVTGR